MRFIIFASFVFLSACSHHEKRPEQRTEKTPVSQNPAPDAGVSIETKQVAAETNAPFSTEIKFAKGSSTLTKESSARLEKILKQAKTTGKIDQIQAYSWADQEYPGQKVKTLPRNANELAESRGAAIKTFLENVDSDLKGKVKIITMTERPGTIAEKLKLSHAREKDAFVDAGIRTTDSKKTAAPKASRAAVMIRLTETSKQ